MSKEEREIIQLDYDTIKEFWDDTYDENSVGTLNGESFSKIETINTSDMSDGDSNEIIVCRKTDSKYFKFSWWEGGSDGYEFSYGDNTLEEVTPKTISKTIYE